MTGLFSGCHRMAGLFRGFQLMTGLFSCFQLMAGIFSGCQLSAGLFSCCQQVYLVAVNVFFVWLAKHHETSEIKRPKKLPLFFIILI